MAQKWVYLFAEGSKGMKNSLGGKGAGLAEMSKAGLPVPPGFTITTEACLAYFDAGKDFPEGMWQQTLDALKVVEKQAGKTFGDPANPLLVSVRSGARVSMPGMMDTVLNLGLNQETLHGLAEATKNQRFALDAYRRLIQLFGRIVKGVSGERFEAILDEYKEKTEGKGDTDLTVSMLESIVKEYKQLYLEKVGEEFPEDPYEQLRQAIGAVFDSWYGKRAVDYRNYNKIPHDWGTAVNIVTMVFGNMGEDSGTGVAFTRRPDTGESVMYGEYLSNAQGEDVVAGIRTPMQISELEQIMPEVYGQFSKVAAMLESHYRDMQDMEFTVERGKLWMLQTRTGKRTAQSAVKIAVDMVAEGLISKEEALRRVTPEQVGQLLHPFFDPKDKGKARADGRFLAKGLNASPGAGTGVAALDADTAEEWAKAGRDVILVRPETSPDDVHGMLPANGILTQRGGATSHAAVVARSLGKPCVAGCEGIRVDTENRVITVGERIIREGEIISVDGTSGEVFSGSIATVEPNFLEQKDLLTLLGWADEQRRLGVWANADYPRDALLARQYGAEGIGLCRTEHMFFEEERRPIVVRMIMASSEAAPIERARAALVPEIEKAREDGNGGLVKELVAKRDKLESNPKRLAYFEALDGLLPFQREDFEGIFEAMDGLPVIVRLIDPPMHEFLPPREELLKEVTELRCCDGDSKELAEKEKMLQIVEAMWEVNPMLGLRGCRAGLMYPGLTEMQVRAILEAACRKTKEGIDVHPEIMIPLVGHVEELRRERDKLEKVAKEVIDEYGVKLDYKIGTMIELPRAALTANEIAEYAQFFSFGTNDLTQMTYGISRDDAEGKFLLQFVDDKILPFNPFQQLDRDGVGKLMQTAVTLGRGVRPQLEIGICGEHGGDPSSIEFCHMVGLNYVSCSPYRVPVARLAAAQAALDHPSK